MRKAVTLLRDGKPFDDFADGDQVTFEINSGEIIQIADHDGKLLWHTRHKPAGKTARMVAAREAKK